MAASFPSFPSLLSTEILDPSIPSSPRKGSCSPLKRKAALMGRVSIDSREIKAARPLFQDSVHGQTFSFEQYNLESPPLGMSMGDFIDLREQVCQIEQQLAFQGLFHEIDFFLIRREIQEILCFPKFSQKMMELGLLCFALTYKPDDLVKKSSTRFAQCVAELEAEVKNPKKSTSEKMFFLQFSFVQMVLFEEVVDGVGLNKGGFLAVLDLLENSTVALHFRDEHRLHMLSVVKKLQSGPFPPRILDEKAVVAPEMRDLLRIDLNLSFQDTCRPIHAHFASLLTLFVDFRQGDREPNCYAIGALTSLTQSRPSLVYSRLMELITTGKCRLQDGRCFPVFPLIAEFFDKKREIEGAELSSTTSVSLASHLLTELNEGEREYENEVGLPGEQNLLQKLLLRVQEFHQCNAKQELSHLGERFRVDKSDKYSFYSPKDIFVNNIICGFKEYFSRYMHAQMTNGHCNDFLNQLEEKLRSVLWMCSRQVDSFYELEFPKLLEDYPHYIKLFYLDETVDGFASIDTIKNASAILSEIVGQVINGLAAQEATVGGASSSEEALPEHLWGETLRKKLLSTALGFLYSHQFSLVCVDSSCQMAEEEHGKTLIKKVIGKTDLLFFPKLGGDGEKILRTFNVTFGKVDFRSESCEHFVSQLRSKLPSRSAPASQVDDSVLLVKYQAHAFTFNPDVSRWFWETPDSNILDAAIKIPGEALLQSPFSVHNQKRVFYALNMFISIPLTEEMVSVNTKISVREFRDNVLMKLGESNRKAFFRSLNETIKRMPSKDFTEEKIGTIFESIGIRMNQQQLKEVVSEMQRNPEQRYFLPHMYARKLNKLIVKRGFPFQKLGYLEHVILRAFSHPSVIDIGDSNHSGDGRFVKPVHMRWVVGFDYGSGKLAFFERGKNCENGFSKENEQGLFNNFQIILPK